MSEPKGTLQYSTLDVLLMMALYHTQRVVYIPVEIFKKHSLYFANHHTGSILLQWPDDRRIPSGKVKLKCIDRRKLRRLVDKYLSLYRKKEVPTTEFVLGCEATNAMLARFVLLQSCRHGKITFEFTAVTKRSNPSLAHIWPLDTASFVLAYSYNGFPVTGIKVLSPNGKARIEVEIDASALWDNVRSHNPTGWRVRLDSTQANYQGHPITFDKSTDKQKRLLDMLASARNGVVKTDDVIKNIPIDETNRKGKKDKEFALQNIRGLHKEIQKKVKAQCKKDGYGSSNFRIEVGEDYVRLIDTSPI